MLTITSVFPLPVSGNAVGCLTGGTRQSATLGGQTSCCLSRRAIRLSLSARQTPFWRKRQTAQHGWELTMKHECRPLGISDSATATTIMGQCRTTICFGDLAWVLI